MGSLPGCCARLLEAGGSSGRPSARDPVTFSTGRGDREAGSHLSADFPDVRVTWEFWVDLRFPRSVEILVLNPPFSEIFFLTRGGFKRFLRFSRFRTPEIADLGAISPLKTFKIPQFFARLRRVWDPKKECFPSRNPQNTQNFARLRRVFSTQCERFGLGYPPKSQIFRAPQARKFWQYLLV